jgi:hypothetical protein
MWRRGRAPVTEARRLTYGGGSRPSTGGTAVWQNILAARLLATGKRVGLFTRGGMLRVVGVKPDFTAVMLEDGTERKTSA